jgi:uncharacterized protein (TIGR02996 family)
LSQHDDADLAAIRVLERLFEREGIEFVSSRGVSALAPAVASFLLRHENDRERSAMFAAWLIDHVEVRDLYVDDEQLEELLRELWDVRPDRDSRPAVEARRADLEAMLLAEPDNFDHRLVYADWLQGHQDPLGELITSQLAAASEPGRLTLASAAASYLREHTDVLFGPLAEYIDWAVHLQWRGGFIETATVGKPSEDHSSYEGSILLRWLLEHRTAMLLRELELHPFQYKWGRDQLQEMLAVVLERPRPLLRRLTVGIDGQTGYLGELSRLDELLPNLEILELRGRSVNVERLRHPKLRRLVWLGAIERKQADAMMASELPSLRALQVPGLHSNVEWLVRVSWRAELEHLDLSGGDLHDDDARLLARLPWPRLRHLDVSNNMLGSEGTATLAALAPTVVIGEQRIPDAYDEFDEDGDGDDEDEEDDEFYESTME